MKCLKKKHSQVKILYNLRILPRQNALIVDLFCQSDFALKEFEQQQSTVIYIRIMCNIMYVIIPALGTYICITFAGK